MCFNHHRYTIYKTASVLAWQSTFKSTLAKEIKKNTLPTRPPQKPFPDSRFRSVYRGALLSSRNRIACTPRVYLFALHFCGHKTLSARALPPPKTFAKQTGQSDGTRRRGNVIELCSFARAGVVLCARRCARWSKVFLVSLCGRITAPNAYGKGGE